MSAYHFLDNLMSLLNNKHVTENISERIANLYNELDDDEFIKFANITKVERHANIETIKITKFLENGEKEITSSYYFIAENLANLDGIDFKSVTHEEKKDYMYDANGIGIDGVEVVNAEVFNVVNAEVVDVNKFSSIYTFDLLDLLKQKDLIKNYKVFLNPTELKQITYKSFNLSFAFNNISLAYNDKNIVYYHTRKNNITDVLEIPWYDEIKSAFVKLYNYEPNPINRSQIVLNFTTHKLIQHSYDINELKTQTSLIQKDPDNNIIMRYILMRGTINYNHLTLVDLFNNLVNNVNIFITEASQLTFPLPRRILNSFQYTNTPDINIVFRVSNELINELSVYKNIRIYNTQRSKLLYEETHSLINVALHCITENGNTYVPSLCKKNKWVDPVIEIEYYAIKADMYCAFEILRYGIEKKFISYEMLDDSVVVRLIEHNLTGIVRL